MPNKPFVLVKKNPNFFVLMEDSDAEKKNV